MRRVSSHILFICVSLLISSPVISQTNIIDSLEKVLRESKEDTVLVYVYSALANNYFNYDTVKSLRYLEEAGLLVKKMNSNYAYGDYYLNMGIMKQNGSEQELAYRVLDTAIMYFQKAIVQNRYLGEVKNSRLTIATCKGQQGDIFSLKGKNKEAIELYLAALGAWKESEDPQKDFAIAVYYGKISTVYYGLEQFDKALEYDKKGLLIHKQGNNDEAIAYALIYICDDYISLKQLDSALLYLAEAEPIVKRLNQHRINIQYLNKLAFISNKRKEYRKAIGYYEKVLEECRITNNPAMAMMTQKSIGYCYNYMKDYTTAQKYLSIAYQYANKNNNIKNEIEILKVLVEVEEQLKNNGQAFLYLKRLNHLKDSVNAQKTKEEIAEIESKYQATEKEKKIGELEADTKIKSLSLKQKSTLNYILIGSLGALLLFVLLGVRNFRHRQMLARQQDELQKQQILALEKDKQLVAVDSMLKGQEEERSRLAKDLHDGLGGMLSGVKFSLMNMKSNLIIDHENVKVFERSLEMLDTSIRELRRVAHNMMPEALVKFGLDEALKDYCNNINQANVLNIKYQSFGMEQRMDKTTEIIIYRVIQELLNNVFKHAKASEVLVQVLREGQRVSITVEDNGVGLDVITLEKTKGAGWTNIRNRVDYLKGKLDLHSEPGKGTSINIELTV